MKGLLILLLFISAFSSKAQMVEEIVIDSCSFISSFIYNQNCDCNYQFDTTEIDLDLLSFNEDERRKYFMVDSSFSKIELDSISVTYFFSDFELEPSTSIDQPKFEIRDKVSCELLVRMSKCYRGFFRIEVSGIKSMSYRFVDFIVFVKNNKIAKVRARALME